LDFSYTEEKKERKEERAVEYEKLIFEESEYQPCKEKILYKEIENDFKSPIDLDKHTDKMSPRVLIKYTNLVELMRSCYSPANLDEFGERELLFLDNLNKSVKIKLFLERYEARIVKSHVTINSSLKNEIILSIRKFQDFLRWLKIKFDWNVRLDKRQLIMKEVNIYNTPYDLIPVLNAIVDEICVLTYMEKYNLNFQLGNNKVKNKKIKNKRNEGR